MESEGQGGLWHLESCLLGQEANQQAQKWLLSREAVGSVLLSAGEGLLVSSQGVLGEAVLVLCPQGREGRTNSSLTRVSLVPKSSC